MVDSAQFVLVLPVTAVSSAFRSFVPSLVNLRPVTGQEGKKNGEPWVTSMTLAR